MTDANGTNETAEQSSGPVEPGESHTDTPAVDAPAAPAMGRELVSYDSEKGAIRIPTHLSGLILEFTKDQKVLTAEQMHLLAPLGIEADWDPAQVAVFFMLCQRRQFDPWSKEAYLYKIGGKFVHHIGIGGFRRKGGEHPDYRGRIAPQFCGPDGLWRDVWLDKNTPPAAARCAILRAGFDEPQWAAIMYDEYAPMEDEWEGTSGNRRKTGRRRPTRSWRCAADGGKPAVMLGKCAEAAAWRVAFPERFSGFYVPEEFERMRAEEATRQPEPNETRERRRAAYATAMQETANAGPAPLFVGLGVSDDDARRLLLAELAEQGTILGKSRSDMTARWSAARGGLPVEEWALRDIVKLVHTIRPLVLGALREAGRDDEANRYQAAPPVGDVETLLGRTPVVIEHETVGASA